MTTTSQLRPRSREVLHPLLRRPQLLQLQLQLRLLAPTTKHLTPARRMTASNTPRESVIPEISLLAILINQSHSGGVTFQLKCNHGTKAKPLGSTVAYTLKDCADQCAANPDCQSCDWDAPSGCRLKAEYIPTFPLQGQLTWFPTTQRAPPCPAKKSPTQIEEPELVKTPKCPDGE